LIELRKEQAIFVGFRLETSLKRQVDAITGPDQRYVSPDDSTFLRICRLGDKFYVGKLIEERLSTERIDDIKRNVFSIMQRLFPEERLPRQLEILAAGGEYLDETPAVEEESGAQGGSRGVW
jgi:hypothetical protein